RPRFQADHVRLLQLQFRGVLAGDDALVVVDEAREAVQQRCLARTGTARDDRVDPTAPDDFQDFAAFRRDRPEADELFERKFVTFEFADGERRPVERKRRRDHVDARAVRQARVAYRRRFVDAPADLTDNALADIQELLIVAEAYARPLDLAGDFDID